MEGAEWSRRNAHSTALDDFRVGARFTYGRNTATLRGEGVIPQGWATQTKDAFSQQQIRERRGMLGFCLAVSARSANIRTEHVLKGVRMLFEDGTGFCPWHKKDSSFKIVHQVRYAAPTYQSPNTTWEPYLEQHSPARVGVLILECMHCGKSLVVHENEVKVPSETPNGKPQIHNWRVMVSPSESPRELHESAPTEVRSLFAEASTCEKAKAFRAAGVMYRATVEELVKEQKATGGNLYDKIESLKGTLSDELVEDLHEARMLGNDSIHAGITYSQEEVEDVAKLIEEAVLVLYVQPEQKRAMREARRARRTDARA